MACKMCPKCGYTSLYNWVEGFYCARCGWAEE